MAGNTAGELPFALQYDATAPKLTAVKAEVRRASRGSLGIGPQTRSASNHPHSRRERPAQHRGLPRHEGDVRRPHRAQGAFATATSSRRSTRPGTSCRSTVTAEARPALYLPAAGAVVRAPSRSPGKRLARRALLQRPALSQRRQDPQPLAASTRSCGSTRLAVRRQEPRPHGGRRTAGSSSRRAARSSGRGSAASSARAASAFASRTYAARTFACRSLRRRRMSASSWPKSLR